MTNVEWQYAQRAIVWKAQVHQVKVWDRKKAEWLY